MKTNRKPSSIPFHIENVVGITYGDASEKASQSLKNLYKNVITSPE